MHRAVPQGDVMLLRCGMHLAMTATKPLRLALGRGAEADVRAVTECRTLG